MSDTEIWVVKTINRAAILPGSSFLFIHLSLFTFFLSLSLSFSAELPFDEGTDSDGVEDDDDVFTGSSQAIKNKQEVTLILYTELTIK